MAPMPPHPHPGRTRTEHAAFSERHPSAGGDWEKEAAAIPSLPSTRGVRRLYAEATCLLNRVPVLSVRPPSEHNLAGRAHAARAIW